MATKENYLEMFNISLVNSKVGSSRASLTFQSLSKREHNDGSPPPPDGWVVWVESDCTNTASVFLEDGG